MSLPFRIKAATVAVFKAKEEIMRILTTAELSRCTRPQLQAALSRIQERLPGLPEGSRERQIALANIQSIRFMLTRPGFRPG